MRGAVIAQKEEVNLANTEYMTFFSRKMDGWQGISPNEDGGHLSSS